VACGMVEDAARELALVTTAVKNKLDFSGGQVALALGGGLLLHETDFRTKVIDAIGARMSIGEVALVEEPALSGARAALELISSTRFGSEGAPSLTRFGTEGDRKGPHPTSTPPPPLQ
jgi:glucosamine kinase